MMPASDDTFNSPHRQTLPPILMAQRAESALVAAVLLCLAWVYPAGPRASVVEQRTAAAITFLFSNSLRALSTGWLSYLVILALPCHLFNRKT